MRLPRLEGRVTQADLVRFGAFTRAWRSFHRGHDADAFRALVRLGLDSAARPGAHDERWSDVGDVLERVEGRLHALGRAVSATPALAAWLLGRAPAGAGATPSAAALAESLEPLLEADWDERCRAHALPRPRASALARRGAVRAAAQALSPVLAPVPVSPSSGPARRRLIATTVRLSPRDFDRAAAHAVRSQLGRQAALVDLVQHGLDSVESEAARDRLDRLLASARRIELQLDLIGPLCASPTSVVVHLWRRVAGLSEEWERVLLDEVGAVSEATWRALQDGPPRGVPPELALDPSDETEGTGWPT